MWKLLSDRMLLLVNQVEYLFVLAEYSPNQLETRLKAFYHYEGYSTVTKYIDAPTLELGFSIALPL